MVRIWHPTIRRAKQKTPAGVGQRVFGIGVWGLWSSPPIQSSNDDPETSFQSILRDAGTLPVWQFQWTPRVSLPPCD